jgi:hypothetical protein
VLPSLELVSATDGGKGLLAWLEAKMVSVVKA